MTDWKTQCETFSQNNQVSDLRYPDTCGIYGAKTIQEVMALSQTLNALKGRIAAGGSTYAASEDDKQALRQSMKTFCCAMRARIDYEERYREAKEDYEVAKQRVESVRSPAAQVSYLGTVIPFGRPLRSDSVPVLLSFIFFFIIMSLGLLLSLGNVQIAYMTPRSYGPSSWQQLTDSYRQTSWPVLLITIAISMGIAFGIYYGVQKTYPEWLNK